MKDAHELLQKLRAAGVEPMSDKDLLAMGEQFLTYYKPGGMRIIRLAADLLEARARLAEVRAWAAAHASEPADSGVLAVGRLCGKEVFEILDREPEP